MLLIKNKKWSKIFNFNTVATLNPLDAVKGWKQYVL